MANFLRRILGPDERLIRVTRLHWIYLLEGVIWFVALLSAGIAADWYLLLYMGGTDADIAGKESVIVCLPLAGCVKPSLFMPGLTWLLGGLGLLILWVHFVKATFAEVAITTRRMIYKTGMISVEVEEVELDDIRAEHVKHGLLGRFLDYGRIHIDCRFVGDIYLPAVRSPYRFLRALHAVRTKMIQASPVVIAGLQDGPECAKADAGHQTPIEPI